MPAVSATAPGKAILFGEHAVVYNRPAIAIPVQQVKVKTTVLANPKGQPDEVWLEAPEVGLRAWLKNLPDTFALVYLIALLKNALSISYLPAMRVTIHSSIPVAGGLGSGTAVSVSVLRALSTFLGHPLTDDLVCALAFEVEKRHHGTPSGIDNTVITFGKPIYFQRGQPIEFIVPKTPFTVVIADTGLKSPTGAAVSGVRQRWQEQPSRYEALFDKIGQIALQARRWIETGEIRLMGALMDANHAYLRDIGVSCPELEYLVNAARQAGAWGAKLSGGGQGGNMIAIAAFDQANGVADALLQAGAVRTIITQVSPPPL